MNEDDVRKIVQLRTHVIKEYGKLNKPHEAPNAIISERDVAILLETLVRSIDDLLGERVNFS